MKSRLPVENLIVNLFVKHTQLALSNGKTYVTVWYKLLRYNLLEATPIVVPMVTSLYTIPSTLLQNGYITNWPCLIIGKRTYPAVAKSGQPPYYQRHAVKYVYLTSLPKEKYLLSLYINWTVLLINLNIKTSICLIQTRMGEQ